MISQSYDSKTITTDELRSEKVKSAQVKLDQPKSALAKSDQVKNRAIKNLIEAHSWIGIIISVVLFLVFWAGSVTLFMGEIKLWSEMPHHPINVHAENMPLDQIIDKKLAEFPFDPNEHLTIHKPSEEYPYYKIFIDLKQEEVDGKLIGEEYAAIAVDPKTGETLARLDQFHLAQFMYILHYNLNLPGGTYIVGIVTLFFFFAIISGVFIHAKKLFRNFFQYRSSKSRRNKLLDMHNVVGVMSLPFTIMFAISGLIFNLAIIYQISFAVFLYQGDRTALLADAGYNVITQKPSGVTQDMSSVYELIDKTEAQYNTPAKMIRFYNYGDEQALVQIYGRDKTRFAQRFEVFYRIKDGSQIARTDYRNNNALRKGTDVIATLHFGNFAGIDLRLLYFILGIAVSGMIIVGNMLWLDKRSLQKNVSEKTIRFVRSLTVGGCGGFVVATATAFLAERVLPITLIERGDWLTYIYTTTLILVVISAYWITNKKYFLARLLQITAALLLITISVDWLMFGYRLIELWQDGYTSIIDVQIGLLLFTGCCVWISRLLLRTKTQVQNKFSQHEIQNQQELSEPQIG